MLAKRLVRRLLTIGAILWASPWTLFGLSVGCVGLATGGRGRRMGRVIEFWGGGVTWFLNVFPLIAGASAVTFGHTVLGRSKSHLEATRQHERVHMRQYERWGLLMVPAYLVCWALLWMAGKNPYYDNPFEQQAFDEAG